MRRILLVEDEEVLREGYTMVLSSGPYETHVAKDGQEALEMCAKTKFDLILLDLMMPVVDGIGFLKKFRLADGNMETKVIVLSNLSSGQELSKAKTLGADRNILKSELSPRQLLATVRYELEV